MEFLAIFLGILRGETTKQIDGIYDAPYNAAIGAKSCRRR
jgi:hypothetical protein